jgi:hypothetical protein
MNPSVTKPSTELTLRDRLSRFTIIDARKLLGANGDKLIIDGASYEIDHSEHVVFTKD